MFLYKVHLLNITFEGHATTPQTKATARRVAVTNLFHSILNSPDIGSLILNCVA